MGNINMPPSPTIRRGFIYSLRPTGDMCVVEDTEFSLVDCFGVVMVTGDQRGRRTFIRRRNFIKGRRVTADDVYVNYMLTDILDRSMLEELPTRPRPA